MALAVSSFTAISATLWRIAWKWPIGRPNALRSSANSTVRSITRRIDPTAPSAMSSRSHWKLAMIR